MRLLIAIVLGILLTVLGLSIRVVWYHEQFSLHRFLRILLPSFGVSSATAFMVLPGIWVAISFAIYNGKLEENFLPGSDANNILVAMVIGVIITLAWVIIGYIDNLRDRP